MMSENQKTVEKYIDGFNKSGLPRLCLTSDL